MTTIPHQGVEFSTANFAELRRLCLAYRSRYLISCQKAAIAAGVSCNQWLGIERRSAKNVGLGAIRKVVDLVLPTSD